MIPLRDHNPSGKIPFITYTLIAINSAIFFAMLTLSEFRLENFIFQFSVIAENITSGTKLYTLITSMFLHGSLGHLIGNMLFLNIFGDNLEERLGHLKYLLFYLLAGFAASFLQIATDPTSTIPNLGASGAIAGIMGGYLLLFPRNRVDVLFTFGFYFRQITLPAYTMLFYWFIFQLFSGVGELAFAVSGGIAFMAHVGGFVAGYLILLPFKQKLRKRRARFLGQLFD